MRRTFILECYASALDRVLVEATGRRAAVAASQLRGEGKDVEYLITIFVPADEIVYHLFAGQDEATAREAGSRAGLSVERVVESVPISGSAP